MNWRETQTFGKWILAGEHAVLRGAPALVFPLKSQDLKLRYSDGPDELSVQFRGTAGEDLKFLFWALLERALELTGKSRSSLTGFLELENQIRVGAGLGASAALCVAMSRYLNWLGWLEEDRLISFSRDLEDLFHGESSGVDIAVAASGQPVQFHRESGAKPLQLAWQPELYLSYCGKRGVTADCVGKVQSLIERAPDRAEGIDHEMREATLLAHEALGLASPKGYEGLKASMSKSRRCFESWELCSIELQKEMDRLTKLGAEAVKPTGSGGGGFVLSLWKRKPEGEAWGLTSCFSAESGTSIDRAANI